MFEVSCLKLAYSHKRIVSRVDKLGSLAKIKFMYN